MDAENKILYVVSRSVEEFQNKYNLQLYYKKKGTTDASTIVYECGKAKDLLNNGKPKILIADLGTLEYLILIEEDLTDRELKRRKAEFSVNDFTEILEHTFK